METVGGDSGRRMEAGLRWELDGEERVGGETGRGVTERRVEPCAGIGSSGEARATASGGTPAEDGTAAEGCASEV